MLAYELCSQDVKNQKQSTPSMRKLTETTVKCPLTWDSNTFFSL